MVVENNTRPTVATRQEVVSKAEIVPYQKRAGDFLIALLEKSGIPEEKRPEMARGVVGQIKKGITTIMEQAKKQGKMMSLDVAADIVIGRYEKQTGIVRPAPTLAPKTEAPRATTAPARVEVMTTTETAAVEATKKAELLAKFKEARKKMEDARVRRLGEVPNEVAELQNVQSELEAASAQPIEDEDSKLKQVREAQEAAEKQEIEKGRVLFEKQVKEAVGKSMSGVEKSVGISFAKRMAEIVAGSGLMGETLVAAAEEIYKSGAGKYLVDAATVATVVAAMSPYGMVASVTGAIGTATFVARRNVESRMEQERQGMMEKQARGKLTEEEAAKNVELAKTIYHAESATSAIGKLESFIKGSGGEKAIDSELVWGSRIEQAINCLADLDARAKISNGAKMRGENIEANLIIYSGGEKGAEESTKLQILRAKLKISLREKLKQFGAREKPTAEAEQEKLAMAIRENRERKLSKILKEATNEQEAIERFAAQLKAEKESQGNKAGDSPSPEKALDMINAYLNKERTTRVAQIKGDADFENFMQVAILQRENQLLYSEGGIEAKDELFKKLVSNKKTSAAWRGALTGAIGALGLSFGGIGA